MKNTINKTIVLLFLLFGMVYITAQTRNVTWVHGLGGSTADWAHYETLFSNERNINSLRESIGTDNGITNAANALGNAIITNYGNQATNGQNIGIGHSMGGLMIRDLDVNRAVNNKLFGGYITVGVPNYGAPIANSLVDGDITAAAQNACSKLASGPVSQFLPLPWGITAGFSTGSLCNSFLTNDLIQGLIGSPVSNQDLTEGSPTIDNINANTTNIPRISMWGNEDSPVHWRMFSSRQYGDDTILVNKVASARSLYNGMYLYNGGMAVVYNFFGGFNPFNWFHNLVYSHRALQWKKGRDWIDDSENIWNALIKTTHLEEQTYWELVYTSNNGLLSIILDFNLIGDWFVFIPDNTQGTWAWQESVRLVSVNYPSDGLLPQYTQIMRDNPTTNNTYLLNGANHIEMKNMSNSTQIVNGQTLPNDATRVQFNRIFNRPINDFFKLD